jgi:hypothetical protein
MGRIQLEDGIRAYRILKLQQNHYNSVLSKAFTQAYVMLLTLCIALYTYATLRLYASLPFSIYILFPFCCISVMPLQIFFITTFYPYPYDKSSKLINETMPSVLHNEIMDGGKNESHAKYVEQEIASCAPVKCYIGKTYFMKASTKLVFINFFSNLTIYLLLTF